MDITVSNFPTWTRSEVCHWGPPGREPTMLPSFLANFFPRSWAVWLGREHFGRDARAGSRLLPQSGSVFSPAVHGSAPESRQESSSEVSADLSSGGSCCVLLVFDSITRLNELYMDSTTPTACRPHRSSFSGHGDRRAHVAARRRPEAPACRPHSRCGCATVGAPGPAGRLLRLTCGGGGGLLSGAHRPDARRRRAGEGRGYTELTMPRLLDFSRS